MTLPAYVKDEIERRMQYAEACWQHVCSALGHPPTMGHDEYCAAVLATLPPLSWTAGGTNDTLT